MVFELNLYVGVSNELTVNGYSLQEQARIYDDQLEDILSRVRFYLDNLDYLPTYRVAWKNYRSKTPPVPYRFVKKQ